jgi:hypothetical protein
LNNNGAAPRITGGLWGVYAAGSATTITNQGRISGNSADGVYLGASGSVANSGLNASITGGINGVNAIGAATIANQGSIVGTSGDGVYLEAGGFVAASVPGSSITGAQWAIYDDAGVTTVRDAGTLTGTTGAVHFANANGNRFIALPGAVINGVVRGGTGTDTIELGSSGAVGTIGGIGGQFTGFEALVVDSGARWVLTGVNTIPASGTFSLGGSGSLAVAGTLTVATNVATSGTLATSGGRVEIGTGGLASANQIMVDAGHTFEASQFTLALAGNVAGAGTLEADAGPHVRLVLDGPSSSIATIVNSSTVEVGTGDTLDVTGSVDPSGVGVFVLDNNSLLEVAADTATNRMTFDGPNGELVVDHVGQFGTNVGAPNYTGPILTDFGGAGESVDLKDLSFTGLTTTISPTGLVQLASGGTQASLQFGVFTLIGTAFHFADDGTGHVLVTHT